jgi:hypothetical protein
VVQVQNSHKQAAKSKMGTHYLLIIRRLLLLMSLILVVVIGISFSAQPGGAAQKPAAAISSMTAETAIASVPKYGISFINSAELLADEQQFANGLATGATWDRYPIYWFYIEKSPGEFDWSRQDAAVQSNLEHNIQLNAILLGTPGFYTTDRDALTTAPPFRHPDRAGTLALYSVETARPQGLYEPVFNDGDTPGPDKNINPDNKWAVFVAAAVNRYKPGGVLAKANNWPEETGVTIWEMWNEADLPFFWDATQEDYARLLKVGYLAAKHADPGAAVMFGGLAMFRNPAYYDQILDIFDDDPMAKSHGYFHDIMAFHNYFNPEHSSDYVLLIQDAMAKRHFEKPIWLNESGVAVWDDYPGPTWEPLSPLRATKTEQGDFLIQSAFYALSAGAEAIYHFQLYDGCGNQPAGTDPPPHDGELCDEDNNYNGLPCAGDANGLYSNPEDAACFRQHPDPESPRPSSKAYKVLTTHVQGVEPYWRAREGDPIYSATCPWSDGTQEWIALYQPAAKKRIVAMWARCEREETAIIAATDPDGVAQLVAPDGTVQQISADNGFYAITLPKATHRNPVPGQTINPVFGIGGPPYFLIETDYRGAEPTPTATSTGTPTATATGEPVCNNLIINGGFENDQGWKIANTPYPARYSTAEKHSGNRSLLAGIMDPQDNEPSYSTATQTVTIPNGTDKQLLRFWLYPQTTEPPDLVSPINPLVLDEVDATAAGDMQLVLILDESGKQLEQLVVDRRDDQAWLFYEFNLSHYVGETIRIYFSVKNDGEGGVTSMYVDDVSLGSCAGATPTPTATATPKLPFKSFEPALFGDYGAPP